MSAPMPPYVAFSSPTRWVVRNAGGIRWKLLRMGFVPRLIGPHERSFRRPLPFAAMGLLATRLRDIGVAFSAGHDWAPAEVVADLRDRGLFAGAYTEISWTGDGWRQRLR